MSANYIGFNVHPIHKAALRDAAACCGMFLGEYLERSLPTDGTTDPPSIAPRRLSPDTVYVAGDGSDEWIGTLASVLRGEPDGRDYRSDGERDAVIIPPKAAVTAMLHHAATGRLTLTPAHLALIESLRSIG